MENLSDFFQTAVNDSIADTVDILAAQAEEGAVKDHLMFEMHEQLSALNQRLDKSEEEAKNCRKQNASTSLLI